jgi:hypothetical protein
MAATNQIFLEALDSFVRTNHGHLSDLYGAKSDEYSVEDFKTILEYSAGIQLKAVFEFRGRLGAEALFEVKRIPKKIRTLDHAAKAIAHDEVGHIINRPLHKSRSYTPNYGKSLSAIVDTWRTKKMRATFRKLISVSFSVDNCTKALLASMRDYRKDPSLDQKTAVKIAVKALNKQLISAHFHAKAGAAWSLRAGFTGVQAARAISTVYIKRMNTLAGSLQKVDDWLSENGIASSLAEGINRRKKILSRELMLANADIEYNNEELDKYQILRQAKYEHGVLNYA